MSRDRNIKMTPAKMRRHLNGLIIWCVLASVECLGMVGVLEWSELWCLEMLLLDGFLENIM